MTAPAKAAAAPAPAAVPATPKSPARTRTGGKRSPATPVTPEGGPGPAQPDPSPDDDQADADDVDQDDDSGAEGGRRFPGRSLSAPPAVEDGAGVLLGLLVWGWVVMPFLKDGVDGVKKVLKAKFLNKAPDGSWLP